MIEAIVISGEKYDVDETTRKYVTKKISRLGRYLPRHARRSVSAEVKLRQINESHGNKYEAEVVFYVPEKTVTAKDSTLNMLAAVDIVEAKLATQLRKYKDSSAVKRGVLSRFKRQHGA